MLQSRLLHREPKDAVAVVAASRTYSVGDILALSAEIQEMLRDSAPARTCAGLKVLVPGKDPGFLLAALFAVWRSGGTFVPFSEESGKPIEVMEPLLKPHAILQLEPRPRVQWLSDRRARPERRADVELTTTGSTGKPKGVCLDLDQLVMNCLLAGYEVQLRPTLRWAISTDLALTSGLCHLLMAWLFGAVFVHLRNLTETDQDESLSQGPFGFGGAPVQLAQLADRAGAIEAPVAVMSSGDFLTAPLIRKVREAFPQARVHKFYGLTEVAGRFCALPHDMIDEHPDAAGRPLDGFTTAVWREDGSQAELGEAGEVFLRSPLLTRGYIREGDRFDPIAPGAWFGTRDMGSMGSDGLLTLLGRVDQSFKVGGEKADSFTIEKALASLLDHRAYCVTPVPHPVLGQCAALFVESSGVGDGPTWQDMVRAVADCLPSRFVPMFGFRLDSLPRLPNGKIDRRNLAANHMNLPRLP